MTKHNEFRRQDLLAQRKMWISEAGFLSKMVQRAEIDGDFKAAGAWLGLCAENLERLLDTEDALNKFYPGSI